MSFANVFSSALIALGFVMWPIIGKYSGIGGAWVGTMISTGTLAAVVALSSRSTTQSPSARAIFILLAVGIINGASVYFYSMRTSDTQISTSAFVVMTCIMMVIWAPLIDWALNGTVPSASHVAGFGTAAITIYLLGG